MSVTSYPIYGTMKCELVHTTAYAPDEASSRHPAVALMINQARQPAGIARTIAHASPLEVDTIEHRQTRGNAVGR
jgi:hypothetical protein